jgi:hypothetical protein
VVGRTCDAIAAECSRATKAWCATPTGATAG